MSSISSELGQLLSPWFSIDGKKKKKKKVKSDFVQAKAEAKADIETCSMVSGIDSIATDTMATEDQLELEALLRQKKQELEGQGQDSEGTEFASNI